MAVLSVKGYPVRYDRLGKGPTVVLLHGGGLDSARLSWAPLTPHLVEHAEVLAPDLPGYGGTPLGKTPATIAGYAAWLRAFLDAAGVKRCLLGGLSLGGAIALQVALDEPARVSGLLLCGPYGVDPRVPGGKLGWLTVHTPGVDSLTWWTLRHSRQAVRATLGAVLHNPVTDDLVDDIQTLARTPETGAAWRAFQRDEVHLAGPRTVFGDALARVDCPAVLLAGDHDVVSSAVVSAAAARIPQGAFVEVPDAGHWLPRDAPGTVAAHLLAMITTVAEPRSSS